MNEINAGSVIVAVDGSAAAERAVCWAAEQAFIERRRLVIVHVADHPDPIDPILDRSVALARTHRAGLAVVGRAIPGPTREALVALTDQAHLLVLGSRGHGAIASKVLGSVGVAVAKHARCPVVVCRPGTELAVKRGVLVGVDGTTASVPVVEFAFQQAAARSQPLTLLHCIAGPISTVAPAHLVVTDEPGVEAARLILAESVAGFREKFPEVHTELHVARGLPADCLATASSLHNLVVVGRTDLDRYSKRLGVEVAASVVERSPSYIAVVPTHAG